MTERATRPRRLAIEQGATMLEYALIATFIAVVGATAAVALGPAVSALFVDVMVGL